MQNINYMRAKYNGGVQILLRTEWPVPNMERIRKKVTFSSHLLFVVIINNTSKADFKNFKIKIAKLLYS